VAADYLPVSEKDLDEMYEELMALMRQVENPYLQKLIQMYFVDNEAFIDAFKHHSAAKTVHHSFVGGLLEHTLGVVKLCDFYVKQYPYLNRDLLFTAALFHDVGKLKEISNFPENDYTDDGQLLGHIVMGCELVGFGCRHIKGFPKKLISELQHCILAHHGELEYGSPKKPALPEAMALNYADNTDAKLETMREILKSAGDNREWLGFNRLFESNLRRSTEF
jgi:3'-5' exoribonuclease